MKPTPAQQQAIETIDREVCVSAGAGSGKTWVLIQRILGLLERDHARLDEIVAITFTDAAAAEMKDRLRRGCRERAQSEAAVNDPGVQSRWRALERNMARARISTIHGFCGAVLRRHALVSGLDPDFTTMPEPETHLLARRVVIETLHRLLAGGHSATKAAARTMGMGALQQTLLRDLNRRGLIERARTVGDMESGEALYTAWQRAMPEINERRLKSLMNSTELARYEARLRRYAGACTAEGDTREDFRQFILAAIQTIRNAPDAQAIERAIKGVHDFNLRRGGHKSTNWDPAVLEPLKKDQDDFRKFLKTYESRELVEAVDRPAAELAVAYLSVFDAVEARYREAKAARNAADFEDLILNTLHLLESNEAVRSRVARGIRYLHIDEFQDTDSIQYRLARLLADAPGGPVLFTVGDAKQSIYHFRGAEVEVFHEAMGDAGGSPVRLDVNYRSLPDVIEWINDVFARSGMLSAVEPAYQRIEPHRPPAGECRVEFWLSDAEGERTPVAELRAQEAALIAARLAEMCSGAAMVEGGDGPRPAQFGDVAMLFRSLTSVYIYERALQDAGIPYVVEAGAGFFARQEVADFRTILALVLDPWDEMALLAYLRGPVACLSDDDIVRLHTAAGSLSTGFHCGEVPEALEHPERLERARALLARFRVEAERPLESFLRLVLDETGLEGILLGQFLGAQKAANVRKLVDLAVAFSRSRPPSLSGFVQHLDERIDQETREGDAVLPPGGGGAVRLMSIHKSKGLEFPIVVLPDVSHGKGRSESAHVLAHPLLGVCGIGYDDFGARTEPALAQAIKADEKDKDDAESARVLYVALTRARDWLLLAGSPDSKGSRSSWLALLDDVFALYDAPEGLERGRSNGSTPYAVYRTPRPFDRAAASRDGEAPALPGDLEAMLAPVAPADAEQAVFAVTHLAAARAGTAEIHDGAEPGPGRAEALERGTLVHAFFEAWDTNTAPDAAADAVLGGAEMAALDPAAMRETLRAAAKRLAASPLWPRFREAAHVHREQPFLLRVGPGAFASGSIDALLDDGTVVDYKTGQRRPGSERVYEYQVQLYAAAVRALTGRVSPEGWLFYVDTGECHRVDVAPAQLDGALELAAAAVQSLR